MKGVIWGQTFESAKEQLDKIIYNYEKNGCGKVRITKDQVLFCNGDVWAIKNASNSTPGLRANIAYIDNRIDTQIIDEVIKPSLTLLPYTAIHYYFPEEMNYIYDE